MSYMFETLGFWRFFASCPMNQAVSQCLEGLQAGEIMCHQHPVHGLDIFWSYLKLFCKVIITWNFSVFSVSFQSHGRAGPGPGSGWWGHLISTCQDVSIFQKREGHAPPVPYTSGWCLNKLHVLTSQCWMPTCLEWYRGFFSSGFADDGPAFTQEKCCPSPAKVLSSPFLSLANHSQISLILEQSQRREAGRWRFSRSHPLRSTIHCSH